MNTPHSDSIHTSLAQLFIQSKVQAIEIPQIQRDYAQGRNNPQVQQIRERFITSLLGALDNPQGIDLDFVFGDVAEVERNGQKVPTLYPLDGQQRLTTLFLLHCYLAWHIPETADAPQPWHAFSYATRPGARAFCEFLTKPESCPDDLNQDTVSAWLKDHARYLPTWKHDPTIQGMLVMLDALHARYRSSAQEKRCEHWQRLTDPNFPAIRFHLLPISGTSEASGASENSTLYVKMNSRGKPLTEFENFKAELIGLLRANPETNALADNFSFSMDTTWTDLFWRYRGKDHLIDQEFMRYLRFLAEVLAWKHDIQINHQSTQDARELFRLAQTLFGVDAPKAGEHLAWMTQALDVWLEHGVGNLRAPRDIEALFTQLFTREAHGAPQPLRVFNFGEFGTAPVGVNLFHACCELYGTDAWNLRHTVLLYGVLQGLLNDTPLSEMHPRLRLLRNLIEASRSEVRADDTRNNMPALLQEVDAIMAGQPLDTVRTSFNGVQARNEQEKQALLAVCPALQGAMHRLEDHDLLRGGLTAFDLNPGQDAGIFERRATRFLNLFTHPYSDVTGALLVCGHIGRKVTHNATYLGAPKNSEPWRDLFRARKGETSNAALMNLLDSGDTLTAMMDKFVNDPATRKDWRYYMVKYPVMRSGDSGRHVIGPGAGYAMGMLSGTYCDNRTYHCDSYLLALVKKAGVTNDQIGNDRWPYCFTGDGTSPRHLELQRSGIKVRCVDAGWEFSHLPEDPAQRQKFDEVMQGQTTDQNLRLYAVPQRGGYDTEDRIERGAQLLQELITAGL